MRVVEKPSVIISESEEIEEFTNAFNSAEKIPGYVDIFEPPHYQVHIGTEIYHLYINEEAGTIMNIKETEIAYSLQKSSVKKIVDLLN